MLRIVRTCTSSCAVLIAEQLGDMIQLNERTINQNIMPKQSVNVGAGVLGVLIVVTAVAALNSWLVMLGAGALGHVFEQPKLFISFGQAVIVTFVLGIIGGFFKS